MNHSKMWGLPLVVLLSAGCDPAGYQEELAGDASVADSGTQADAGATTCTPACPSGRHCNNGVCEADAVCGQNEVLTNGGASCECAPGYSRPSGTQTCMPTSTGCGSGCGTGTHCQNNQCVVNDCGGACANGTHCDTATNQCEPDTTGCGTGCGTGFHCEGNQCVPDSTGTTRVTLKVLRLNDWPATTDRVWEGISLSYCAGDSPEGAVNCNRLAWTEGACHAEDTRTITCEVTVPDGSVIRWNATGFRESADTSRSSWWTNGCISSNNCNWQFRWPRPCFINGSVEVLAFGRTYGSGSTGLGTRDVANAGCSGIVELARLPR
jgi:hypothetical protein